MGLSVELCLAHKQVAQSSHLCFSLACEGTRFFLLLFHTQKRPKYLEFLSPYSSGVITYCFQKACQRIFMLIDPGVTRTFVVDCSSRESARF